MGVRSGLNINFSDVYTGWLLVDFFYQPDVITIGRKKQIWQGDLEHFYYYLWIFGLSLVIDAQNSECYKTIWRYIFNASKCKLYLNLLFQIFKKKPKELRTETCTLYQFPNIIFDQLLNMCEVSYCILSILVLFRWFTCSQWISV